MTVQFRECPIRKRPSFLSPVSSKVKYGTKLEALKEKKSWYQVKQPAGWVHKSALTKKQLNLSKDATQAGVYASQDEVTLAGKGFNRQVEQKYRQKNPLLQFDQIDQIEKLNIPTSELANFLQQGGLNTTGGKA